MSAFEYMFLFGLIILGLAVTDLATSLHRLLAAGSRVKWDWLAPLAALTAFLKIVSQWWRWHVNAGLAQRVTFEMFLGLMVGAVLLFLMTAAALPDYARTGEVDLRQHYESSRRRYWILFVSHWCLMNLLSTWAQTRLYGAALPLATPALVVLPIGVSMFFVRARWWHTFGFLVLIVLYVGQFFGKSLT